MDPSQVKFSGAKVVATSAYLVIIVAGLKAASAIAIPFVLALFLAVLGAALLSFTERFKIPRTIGVILTCLLLVGGVLGLAMLLGASVNEFTRALPQYRPQIAAFTKGVEDYVKPYGYDFSSTQVFGSLEPSAVMELVGSTLRGLVNTLSKTVVVIVMILFMLLEAAEFREKLRRALGEEVNLSRVESISTEIQRYLGIKTITSLFTGVCIGLFVAFMGIDFPILWGLVGFLMNYIPFFGSILASIPAVMLAIVQLGFPTALITVAGYLVINLSISNLLEPILMGRHLGLSPLIVFLSLIFWGWVWGPVGALLSVPLAMTLKIFLEHSKEFTWAATMMGSKPVAPMDIRLKKAKPT